MKKVTNVIIHKYSIFTKILYVIGYPILTALFIRLLLDPLWINGKTIEQNLLTSLLAVVGLYYCGLGIYALRYLNIEIKVEGSFLVYRIGNHSESLAIEKLGTIKEYSYSALYKDMSDRTLFFVFDSINDVNKLKSLFSKNK